MEFNLAEVHEALAEPLGSRDAVVSPSRRVSWSAFTARTRRLANFLLDHDVSIRRAREELSPWESGQDHVAICLYSGIEYLEAMYGAMKARAAPCNVNYRYRAQELAELLDDMRPKALVYQTRFAEQLGEALAAAGLSPLLVEVGDGQGPSLPGALEYEAALATASPNRPDLRWSPDDLYVIYTGGTTGRPKGVLWRQADLFVTATGGRNYREGRREWRSLEELVTQLAGRDGVRSLTAAPMMHGTGQWVSLQAFHTGGTVVLPAVVERFDADSVLDAVRDERVNLLAIAGESFAKPLIEAIDRKERDLTSLIALATSGAALSPVSKEELLARLPGLRIRDTMGSSEAGPVAEAVDRGSTTADHVRFSPSPDTFVLDEARTRRLTPGEPGPGWLARTGRIPLGYLNDPEKTAQTFPVIEGRRTSVAGDRARVSADGQIEVLGRDAVTINSGGEKIFAEEVEAAIIGHPAVRDVLVVGRPSERWGSEVVALVEPEAGQAVEPTEIVARCRAVLADYKAPKDVVVVPRVMRNPAGKADYAWARRAAVHGHG
jgi:fatty-acyl-CoA synthase